MRRRAPVTEVDVGRLASTAVTDWIAPDERARLAELIDDARAGDDLGALADVAPGAGYVVLIDDRDRAVSRAEKLIVAHRRRLDAWRLAVSQRRDAGSVALELHLGHVSEPGADDGRWTAASRIG